MDNFEYLAKKVKNAEMFSENTLQKTDKFEVIYTFVSISLGCHE